MDFESKLRSLTDLLDIELAEQYIMDTSVLGINFIHGGRGLGLKTAFAAKNNIHHSKLKEAYKSSSACLEILRKYGNVGTVPVAMEELETGHRLLGRFAHAYGSRRNVHRSTDGLNLKTSAGEREKRMLYRLVEKEQEVLDILRERTLVHSDERVMGSYEDFVVYAGRVRSQKGSGSTNDEKIIAAALYHAFEAGQHVAVVTSDNRFREIAFKTQCLLANVPGEGKKLYEFLKAGNLSIIKRETDAGFGLDYWSGDFVEHLAPAQTVSA